MLAASAAKESENAAKRVMSPAGANDRMAFPRSLFFGEMHSAPAAARCQHKVFVLGHVIWIVEPAFNASLKGSSTTIRAAAA
jgi:hypothetical protein